MDFNDLKVRVERWAQIRGIYDESTEAKQQAKALEEIGEFITAETDDEKKDALGDIAVCIINAGHFKGSFEYGIKTKSYTSKDMPFLAQCVLCGGYRAAIRSLEYIAWGLRFDINECYQMAWDEIKDRKGMMVDGYYVKWDDLTQEQRDEFERRSGG